MPHHHQHHRPLHARKDPRKVSGGRSAYVYRREAGASVGFGGNPRFPTLYVSKKIQDKPGLTFFHCPHFKHLRGNKPEDDIANAEKEREAREKLGKISNKELEKTVEKIEEKKKKIKQKRKEKRDPSITDIRKHLEKIIKYHCKKVNDEIPSIYPILGPVNIDSSDDDGDGCDNDSKRGGLKMLNTKQELKKY